MKRFNRASVLALGLGFGLTSGSAKPFNFHYVAMGSSFAAGPGILPGADDPGSVPCGRSSANYAHFLARRNKLALTDVTCGDATTANILEQGQFGAAAQIDAVTADTQLVTVTIGGNDVFYTATMGGLACQNHAGDPAREAPTLLHPAFWREDRSWICGPRPTLAQIAAEVAKGLLGLG